MAASNTVADRLPFAPVAAAIIALGCATLAALTPVDLLAQGVVATGLPTLLPAAAPPLGLKAQALVVGLVALTSLVVLWALLTPLGRRLDRPRDSAVPVATETEPVAAPAVVASRRRPIFAADELGAPLMSAEALAAPVTIDPVNAVDSDDVADKIDVTAPPLDVDPVLATPLGATEFELVETEPAAMPTTDPVAGPAFIGAPTSLDDLVARLEAGLARRDDGDPTGPGMARATPQWLIAARAELGLPRHDTPGDAGGDDMRAELRQALGAMRAIAAR